MKAKERQLEEALVKIKDEMRKIPWWRWGRYAKVKFGLTTPSAPIIRASKSSSRIIQPDIN
jgi:hypothetical protein